MKFVYGFVALQCFILLLLSHDVNSSSIDNDRIEAGMIDKRSAAPKKTSEQCAKNEVYSTCAPSCETTCDDINNDDRSSGERCVGAAVCNKKCACKKDHVRDSTGKCIRYQECPRVKH